MPVTPEGPLSIPIDKLRDNIANSARFQTWTGLASPVLAKPRVYPIARDRASVTRPYAVVSWSPTAPKMFLRELTGPYARGFLFAFFEGTISSANVPPSVSEDAFYEFANHLGIIMQQMMNYSQTSGDGALIINSIDLVGGPSRSDLGEISGEGEVYWGELRIFYGGEGA